MVGSPGASADEGQVVRVLRAGSWKKAELRQVQTSHGMCVVKDYRSLAPLVRLYAMVTLRREEKAYAALADVPGIPRRYPGQAGTLVLQHVEGIPISRLMGTARGPAAFLSLRQGVQAMHACGVFHLDLRKRDNILVTGDDQVWLVDFASATCLRPGTLKNKLLRRAMAMVDGYAVLKWKSVLDPDGMSPKDWSRVRWLDRIRFRS